MISERLSTDIVLNRHLCSYLENVAIAKEFMGETLCNKIYYYI